MATWIYVLHHMTGMRENVQLIELATNTTHAARPVGAESYEVTSAYPIQFYAWQVRGMREWIDALGPKCDWMAPARIARITHNMHARNDDYFNDCTMGKPFKARQFSVRSHRSGSLSQEGTNTVWRKGVQME
jgi:hypothetical protein